MSTPYGPYKIAKNGQVVLAREVLSTTGLRPGDSVYLVPNDAEEGTILVVPVDKAAEWFSAGRAADVAKRPVK